ncbi:MAG: hypothetical protein ACXVCP_02210 [Bdellovibrio sp.]
MGNDYPYLPTKEKIEQMKQWAFSLEEVTPFLQFPHESSFIMSYTLALEVGGPNDNLSKHIIDSSTGICIGREHLNAEMIERDGVFGVRFFSPSNSSIKIGHSGLSKLLSAGSSDFTLFPVCIAKKLEATGIEPVLIKDWLISAIFSEFNPHLSDYRSQMSELLNNDAFLYAKLVSQKKMVFQSLHDIIEHSTNATGSGWDQAQTTARVVYTVFSKYFGTQCRGNIPSHVLPFVIGVLLDDLTQSPFYGAAGRVAVINELLTQLKKLEIEPQSPLILKEFPSSIETVLIIARKPNIEENKSLISNTVLRLVNDLYAFTH